MATSNQEENQKASSKRLIHALTLNSDPRSQESSHSIANSNITDGINMMTSNGISLSPNTTSLSLGDSIQAQPLGSMYPFISFHRGEIDLNSNLSLNLPQQNIIGNQRSVVFPTQIAQNQKLLALANRVSSTVSDYCNLPLDFSSSIQHRPTDRPYHSHELLPTCDTRKEKGGSSKFPAKLHLILARTDVSDIITWCSHGRAWKVLNPKAFVEEIIPMYFRHCKYNSFTRQVNGWGFRRITQGPDQNAYYHECFLRDAPHLVKNMRRLTVDDVSRKESASRVEPNFYLMGKIAPVSDTESIISDNSTDKTCSINGFDVTRRINILNGPGNHVVSPSPQNATSKTRTIDSGSVTSETTLRTYNPSTTSPNLRSQVQQMVVPCNLNSSLVTSVRQQLLQAQYVNAMNLNNSPSLLQQNRFVLAGNSNLFSQLENTRNNLQEQILYGQILTEQAILTSLQRRETSRLHSAFGNLGIPKDSQMTSR